MLVYYSSLICILLHFPQFYWIFMTVWELIKVLQAYIRFLFRYHHDLFWLTSSNLYPKYSYLLYLNLLIACTVLNILLFEKYYFSMPSPYVCERSRVPILSSTVSSTFFLFFIMSFSMDLDNGLYILYWFFLSLFVASWWHE